MGKSDRLYAIQNKCFPGKIIQQSQIHMKLHLGPICILSTSSLMRIMMMSFLIFLLPLKDINSYIYLCITIASIILIICARFKIFLVNKFWYIVYNAPYIYMTASFLVIQLYSCIITLLYNSLGQVSKKNMSLIFNRANNFSHLGKHVMYMTGIGNKDFRLIYSHFPFNLASLQLKQVQKSNQFCKTHSFEFSGHIS